MQNLATGLNGMCFSSPAWESTLKLRPPAHSRKRDFKSPDMTSRRIPLIILAAALTGCEPLTITAAGIGAATGIGHVLGGIVYRTFSEPLPKVKKAALASLKQMGFKVEGVEKKETGEVIKATAKDRQIEVELEAISPATTRMTATAKNGLVYDSATATEIILQTERLL